MKRLMLIGFLFIIVGLTPTSVLASSLFMESSDDQYNVGDTFTVNVKIDTEKNCINAGEISIKFPSDLIKYKDFSSGNSIFSLWVDSPNSKNAEKINRDGKVVFSGGTPGGYCGYIPGDPGESNIIGSLVFYVPNFLNEITKNNLIKLEFLPETSIYLNDGRGTKDNINTSPLELAVVSDKLLNKEEWEDLKKQDNIKPEPFVVELRKDEGVFDEKYYIIFATTDKQTGIDHYEVLELKSGEVIGVAPKATWIERLLGKKKEAPNWKEAASPYLLTDQSLESNIRVKAVDKAGNATIVEYIPSDYKIASANNKNLSLTMAVIIIIILGLVYVGFLIVRKRK